MLWMAEEKEGGREAGWTGMHGEVVAAAAAERGLDAAATALEVPPPQRPVVGARDHHFGVRATVPVWVEIKKYRLPHPQEIKW